MCFTTGISTLPNPRAHVIPRRLCSARKVSPQSQGSRIYDHSSPVLPPIFSPIFSPIGKRARCSFMGRRGMPSMTRRGRTVPINCVQIDLVVTFDGNNQKVRLSLCQAEVLKALAKDEELSKNGGCVPDLQLK